MKITAADGKLICECDLADTPSKRTSGLMFAKKKKNILFLFDRDGNHAIHSFFVPYVFHAIYVDAKKRVVDVFEVKPWVWLVKSRAPARYLLEISKGEIPKIGDELCWDGKS
jgi:uncharacterized membrane protein (UPF0127 family)